jgi:hypothetical protein
MEGYPNLRFKLQNERVSVYRLWFIKTDWFIAFPHKNSSYFVVTLPIMLCVFVWVTEEIDINLIWLKLEAQVSLYRSPDINKSS